jgi:Thrombospondin type 3 repeat
MKKLVILLAASAALAGCVAVPYDSGRPPPPRPYADRDRDGVPNRMDRDRDGDGVPNRYDSRPNNPNRN